ncbi:MAG: hypothetical protein J6U68_03175, partial [Clostridia bacterium]|nr:hypothetical protein [Clostridia bacterium]
MHGSFTEVDGRYVYSKINYGNKDFKLDISKDGNVFLSVGVSGGNTEIYGFKIFDGKLYPLSYKIVNGEIDLVAGDAILDISAKTFKVGQEYLISKEGAYAVYASIGTDKTVSIKVYASEDTSKILSVSARMELGESNTMFVSSEISKKLSYVSFTEGGVQSNSNIYVNNRFSIDESTFESECISSVSVYYSKLNDLDASNLAGKTNIYAANKEYEDEGFYLVIVRNLYGNERVYKIAISKGFGVTSSVTFADGQKVFYSIDYKGTLYSNGEITLDILEKDITISVTLNGALYKGFVQKKEGDITYLVFSEAGKYVVELTDSYGNKITRQLEINKSTYTLDDKLLTGYNEKALKRNEGYTNQKLSVDKDVYDRSGIYYLAIQYGDTLNVLFDAFAESPIITDKQKLANVIGANGDGVYKVICRNRYGAVVTKEIHYRATPTLKLERTTRSQSEPEAYDLSRALSLGFWSNNILSFSTDAKTYVFTINGSATECPKALVFEGEGDAGSFEYVITYIDEYGFEYSFKAYLVRKNLDVNISPEVGA